jgi:hypothetical protein
MTKEEALKILELYRHWNNGQTSLSLSMENKRTEEDDIYDERRRLIKTALRILQEPNETTV